MTSLNSPTTSQLDVLRNAIKDQCTSNSTALDNHQEDAKDISIIALELIDEKMHQLLSCDKNITDLKAYGKFEEAISGRGASTILSTTCLCRK